MNSFSRRLLAPRRSDEGGARVSVVLWIVRFLWRELLHAQQDPSTPDLVLIFPVGGGVHGGVRCSKVRFYVKRQFDFKCMKRSIGKEAEPNLY